MGVYMYQIVVYMYQKVVYTYNHPFLKPPFPSELSEGSPRAPVEEAVEANSKSHI